MNRTSMIAWLVASSCWLLTGLGLAEPAPKTAPYKRYKTPTRDERAAMAQRAVKFLVAGQHETGAFGLGKESGVTAVVLHALLVADPAFRSPNNPTTQKALGFLLRSIQPDGHVGEPEGGYENYKTSISVLALSSLTEKEYASIVQAAMESGIIPKTLAPGLGHERVLAAAQKWITEQQATEKQGFERDKDPGYGGQGYGGVPAPDLSNSHFALEALATTGRRRGDPFLARMEVFLNRTQNLPKVNDLTDKAKFPELKEFAVTDDGGFGYAPAYSKAETTVNEEGKKISRSYASMTAAGLKSLLLVGAEPQDLRVQAALKWFSRNYTLEFNAGLDEPGKPEKGLQALYYFYWTFARAMNALGNPTLKLADGTEVEWAGELLGKLKSLQREDGSWKNEHSRWMEADPFLVTGYALLAAHYSEKMLKE